MTFFQTVPLTLAAFTLTLFTEKRLHAQPIPSDLEPFPERECSVLSRLTFWWLNALIVRGFSAEIDRQDMWRLEDKETCQALTDRVAREWARAADEYMEKRRGHWKRFLGALAAKCPEEQEACKKDYRSEFSFVSFYKRLFKIE